MLATYSTDMRDTSKDFRTYWIRNGLWYGRMNSLGETDGLEQVLAQIPEPDRQVVAEEAASNAAFRNELVRISKHPGWEHKVSESARCAILNELDPSKCRNQAWKWGRLRSRLRKLIDDSVSKINRNVSRMTFDEKMAVVRKLAAGERPTPMVSGLGELGQWDIISGLVSSVAGATANIYTAKITTDAQRDVAKIQATTAMRDAQTAIAMQNAQSSINAAKAGMGNPLGPLAPLASASIGGVPVWIVLAGTGAVIYFMFKR